MCLGDKSLENIYYVVFFTVRHFLRMIFRRLLDWSVFWDFTGSYGYVMARIYWWSFSRRVHLRYPVVCWTGLFSGNFLLDCTDRSFNAKRLSRFFTHFLMPVVMLLPSLGNLPDSRVAGARQAAACCSSAF